MEPAGQFRVRSAVCAACKACPTGSFVCVFVQLHVKPAQQGVLFVSLFNYQQAACKACPTGSVVHVFVQLHVKPAQQGVLFVSLFSY